MVCSLTKLPSTRSWSTEEPAPTRSPAAPSRSINHAREPARIVNELQVEAGNGTLLLEDVVAPHLEVVVVDDRGDPVAPVTLDARYDGVVSVSDLTERAVALELGVDLLGQVALREDLLDVRGVLGEIPRRGEQAHVGVGDDRRGCPGRPTSAARTARGRSWRETPGTCGRGAARAPPPWQGGPETTRGSPRSPGARPRPRSRRRRAGRRESPARRGSA